MKTLFTLFGKQFSWSYITDKTCRRDFGGIVMSDNGYMDTREYWHRVCLGLYVKSESWLRIC